MPSTSVTVPGRAELEIARDEGDADGIAGTERFGGGGASCAAPPVPPASSTKPAAAERRERARRRRAVESTDAQRERDGPERRRRRSARTCRSGACRPGERHERPRGAKHRRRTRRPAPRSPRRSGLASTARRRRRAAPGRGVHHLANRRDAGDRLGRERAEGVRHGADQTAVDVDRAAAHAGDDARLGERAAARASR